MIHPNSTYLVTGASGFIGTYLVLRLLQEGVKDIICVSRKPLPEDHPLTPYSGLQWFHTDLARPYPFHELERRVEVIFHCAAKVSFDRKDETELWRVNTLGTESVVNLAIDQQVRHLVFLSSVASLSQKDEEGFFHEGYDSELPEFPHLYARSKYMAEMECWRAEAEGVEVTIVNPSLVLGSWNRSQGISRFFEYGLQGGTWCSGGSNGVVDVRDVVEALIRIVADGITGRRIILNGANVRLSELLCRIQRLAGLPEKTRELPPLALGLAGFLSETFAWLTSRSVAWNRRLASISSLSRSYRNDVSLQAIPGFRYRSLDETLPEILASFKSLPARSGFPPLLAFSGI